MTSLGPLKPNTTSNLSCLVSSWLHFKRTVPSPSVLSQSAFLDADLAEKRQAQIITACWPGIEVASARERSNHASEHEPEVHRRVVSL